MAKQRSQPKQKQKEQKQRVFGKEDVKVSLASSFVYCVDIYKYNHNGVNLEDSRYVKSKEWQTNGVSYFIRDEIRYRKEIMLVAAPEQWLNENKYTELCKEQVTQKS